MSPVLRHPRRRAWLQTLAVSCGGGWRREGRSRNPPPPIPPAMLEFAESRHGGDQGAIEHRRRDAASRRRRGRSAKVGPPAPHHRCSTRAGAVRRALFRHPRDGRFIRFSPSMRRAKISVALATRAPTVTLERLDRSAGGNRRIPPSWIPRRRAIRISSWGTGITRRHPRWCRLYTPATRCALRLQDRMGRAWWSCLRTGT